MRVGGDSQARATRTAPWEEEAAPGWGLGLKCQVAGQVAMATKTKTGTEERLGTGAPRRAPAAAGPWGSPGSLYWTGVEHQQELMGSQPFRRACRFSSIQVLGSACSVCQDLPCCLPACSVGGAPQQSQLLGDKEQVWEGHNQLGYSLWQVHSPS